MYVVTYLNKTAADCETNAKFVFKLPAYYFWL